ncbi:MAG: hypothetical protein FGF48_09825 [Candidatus Brockarchaeota archaeon]|nr:hypothetical protein [Candidatus Brockarchaeota archaeon]
MFTLDDNVKARITGFLPGFRKWLETDEGKEFLKEREDKEREFKTLLNAAAIEQLSEPDFRRIIVSLWAYVGWTNKDYVADRILKSTDFNTLRSELKNLLYGAAPLASRYDRFFEKVKFIGPAGVTEILAFAHPEQYGIWNDKSRRGLEILGLGEALPTKKYRISGSEYERVNEALKAIFRMINPEKVELNLINVDLFLFYLVARRKEETAVGEEEDYDFDHDEIVEKLVEVGSGLGFEASSEYQVAKGARVDVLWQAKIANLGVVSYVFEVQRGGSIDSLILNLQRAKNNPTVQKLVVVANTKDLKRIREEVESLSEDFRKSLAYLEAKDVERASDLLAELNTIISRLELVKSS